MVTLRGDNLTDDNRKPERKKKKIYLIPLRGTPRTGRKKKSGVGLDRMAEMGSRRLRGSRRRTSKVDSCQ